MLTFIKKNLEKEDIKNILENKICEELSFKKSIIVDVFYAIYKESPLTIEEFKNRLNENIENIVVDCLYNNCNGSYVHEEKAIYINEKFLEKGPSLNFVNEIVLNEKDTKNFNNFNFVRSLIHEGLHAIANNNFRNFKDESKDNVILDELKTVQLEAKIFHEVFEDKYSKGNKIYKSKLSESEFKSGKDDYYAITNDENLRGYKFLNTLSNRIDFIDKSFNDVYWNKKNINETTLVDEIFIDFSKNALIFNDSILEDEKGFNIENFNNYLNSFYKCIDYQIKNEKMDRNMYEDLRDSILNSRYEFPKKNFIGEFDKYTKDYDDSLNFDIYYLKKIEEENFDILKINVHYDVDTIDKIDKILNDFKLNKDIDSSSYLKKDLEL